MANEGNTITVIIAIILILFISNLFAYLETKEKMNKPCQCLQSCNNEEVLTGIPWDQIHYVFYGIGEGVGEKNLTN